MEMRNMVPPIKPQNPGNLPDIGVAIEAVKVVWSACCWAYERGREHGRLFQRSRSSCR